MDIATPLSTSGRFIVDAHGRRVRLAGVSWYGAEQDFGVAAGLERTPRSRLAKTIAGHGFNSVRLLFSLWMTEQADPVPDEYLAANRDLSGSTPMQVYDAGLAPSSQPGQADSAVWWNNIEAWVTDNDVDWCWWALNPTNVQGTIPVTNQRRWTWGDPHSYGLLAPDWRGVANPAVLDMLKSMIRPRTGPGVG